jgi:rod shape determining protein RodA
MNKGRNWWKDFDWAMLALALAICAVGLVQIASATRGTPLAGLQWKQLAWIVMGLAGMALIARIDYHAFLEQAPILYLLALLALFAVLMLGHRKFGARRWIEIAGQGIQVSEVVKVVIIIALARYFSELRTERLTLMDLAKIGVLAGLPTALILLQPDLGTALVLIALTGVGVFLAGVEWKHAIAMILLGALLIPVGWHYMKPYQKHRIEAFLDPEETAQSSGYQTLQSKIAVGSGGVWGKGLNQGSQNQLGFVPVRWADFILAGLAEEQGFAGVLVALLLYMGLLLRLVGTAQLAGDRAGMYLVMGVAAVLGFHVLVNTAMVIGYMPVTGIPLPLMSHGGSATLFVFLALGLATNVRLRRFVN